jgi:hypothetical protein
VIPDAFEDDRTDDENGKRKEEISQVIHAGWTGLAGWPFH